MIRCLLLAALLLLAAACTAPSPGPQAPSPAGSPAVTPAASPSPGGEIDAVPEGLTTSALVTRVVDGDTIDVLVDGQQRRVRYIGVDTPESVDPRRPVECLGREAGQRNRELVEGKTVALEKDVSETDVFGRLLRYVWLGDRMVNAALVAEGYAVAATYPPDVRYAELFASLQAAAREEGLGLWGEACATPSPGPASTAPATGLCDYSGTDEPVIKGNISVRTGERIYHVPGGEYYDETVISEEKGERWFCTEAEAVAAGWRKSKR